MKVTKVYGHIISLIRKEDGFVLTLRTECNKLKNDAIIRSNKTIEISYGVKNTSMSPIGEFEQSCMALLEEFNDTTILLEANDSIREAYFIGKLIDEISFDIIMKTRLTKYYEGTFMLSHENNN